MSAGAGRLEIADRGGEHRVAVDHWGAKPAYQINGPGQLSVFIEDDLARRLGAAGVNWCGAKWAYYFHPDLPTWGGVVTRPQWTPGVLEPGAESFHVLMRARIVPRVYQQAPSPAGALALRAFSDVQSDDSMLVTFTAADEEGAVFPVSTRGGDLLDEHFRQLASASGQEFDVDADRNVSWRVRLGTFKPNLMLTYPGAIVDYSYSGDLWTAKNEIEGVASDARQDRSVTERLRHTASIREIGTYQTSIRYPEAVSPSTLRPLILRDLKRLAWPAETMSLTVMNRQHVWSQIRLGDSFFVRLTAPNVTRRVRVLAMSADVDAGTMGLTTEVEGEADGW